LALKRQVATRLPNGCCESPRGVLLAAVSTNELTEHSDATEPFRPEDWLTASETIRLVRLATMSRTANVAIATRANAGLVRAHAEALMIGSETRHNVPVPAKFWWATGHEALTQNWETGDFETWVDRRFHLQAFGVRFHREDIQRMVPGAFPTHQEATAEPANRGGRRMSELWPEWVAELALHVHEAGAPPGVGSQGADELIAAVAERLAARGLEAPSRTTVQEAVSAVLRRLRAG
jgi:hypothetical protein